MEKLKELFVSLGFVDVRTILASGNVMFSSQETDTAQLTKEVETALVQNYNLDSSVIIRNLEYIQELIKSNPFKNIQMKKGVRLHVTFLNEKSRKVFTVPFESPKKDFGIISATSNEVFLAIYPDGKTPDAMLFLEKQFGNHITTRSWNTVVKIGNLTD